MNTTNDLETQLRSWIPRHPSARLEKRLFRKQRERVTTYRLHWFAPAAAALAMLVMIAQQRGGSSLSDSRPGPIVGLIPSNQLAEAVASGPDSNRPASSPGQTFEWTNGRSWTSSISSLSATRGTN